MSNLVKNSAVGLSNALPRCHLPVCVHDGENVVLRVAVDKVTDATVVWIKCTDGENVDVPGYAGKFTCPKNVEEFCKRLGVCVLHGTAMWLLCPPDFLLNIFITYFTLSLSLPLFSSFSFCTLSTFFLFFSPFTTTEQGHLSISLSISLFIPLLIPHRRQTTSSLP